MAVAVKDANGRLVGGIAIFPDRGTLLDRHISPLHFGKGGYGLILDNKGVTNVMNVISDIADQASDQVRSIATASEEQSASSEEINMAVGGINCISSEPAEVMEQSAQAIADLARLAQELNSIIRNLQDS